MRQWASALVILIVVIMLATFAVGSIVTIVHATSVLQQSVGAAEELVVAESLDECDLFDSSLCF
jgi:hypothetical protein